MRKNCTDGYYALYKSRIRGAGKSFRNGERRRRFRLDGHEVNVSVCFKYDKIKITAV